LGQRIDVGFNVGDDLGLLRGLENDCVDGSPKEERQATSEDKLLVEACKVGSRWMVTKGFDEILFKGGEYGERLLMDPKIGTKWKGLC
jgi:hypothetical protein